MQDLARKEKALILRAKVQEQDHKLWEDYQNSKMKSKINKIFFLTMILFHTCMHNNMEQVITQELIIDMIKSMIVKRWNNISLIVNHLIHKMQKTLLLQVVNKMTLI